MTLAAPVPDMLARGAHLAGAAACLAWARHKFKKKYALVYKLLKPGSSGNHLYLLFNLDFIIFIYGHAKLF